MEAALPIGRLLTRNITVAGIAIWNNPHYWDSVATFRDLILPAVADGRIKAVVDAVVPLDRAGEGLQMLADRRISGKVVVAP
jgi:NADPH2:quinone reductase